MSFSFAIISDAHLGKRQYGLQEREDDFYKAWILACRSVAQRTPDFVLIPGDLFDQRIKPGSDPAPIDVAYEGLQILSGYPGHRPIIAIEGNHDFPTYSGGFSWLDFFVERGLVLNPTVSLRQDGILPLDVTILGFPWAGMATNRQFADLAKFAYQIRAERPDEFIIGMIHAGVQDMVPDLSGGHVDTDLLLSSRGVFNCITLGHYHKPFTIEDWIFNPGSLEVCSIKELEYNGGMPIMVYVYDDNKTMAWNRVEPTRTSNYWMHDYRRRSFVQFSLYLSSYDNQQFAEAACMDFAKDDLVKAAIVLIRLSGEPKFRVNTGRLRDIFMESGALSARVYDETEDAEPYLPDEKPVDELGLLTQLVSDDPDLAQEILQTVSRAQSSDYIWSGRYHANRD